MTTIGQDSLKVRRTLDVAGKRYGYYSLPAAQEAGLGNLAKLPFSLKVLIENLLRHEDGKRVRVDDIRATVGSMATQHEVTEIAFCPARVLMQDFTGIPAIVDLAAMRDAMVARNADPARINPLIPVDLVIDHSVMVDAYGTAEAFARNVSLECQRNQERYAFFRWGQEAFQNFRVVPPGTGICHQVNLEYLSQVVWVSDDPSGSPVAYPDTLVGTDSHTTMVNGLAVLGWGVGGIEAEAAMLGQAISMLIPKVVGFKLTGKLPEGATATDLVLTVTNILRAKGVVGKFVEFYGDGLDSLSLPDRATVSNMAPEYGATCGFFPIDQKTIEYLTFTGREPDRIALVEAYAKAQGLWRDAATPDPEFSETLVLDLASVYPTLAGPKRPQDKILLPEAKSACEEALKAEHKQGSYAVPGKSYSLGHGDIVIAAMTSCTNTSNPSVMVAAGLLAQKALAKGLRTKPWVKTSLAPGSQVVTDYLQKAGLDKDLDALGFNLVGYGCTTCIGNSGPLQPEIVKVIEDHDLTVGAVLSGNRNFEGRIHSHVKANYLASPPLVVAYALAGSMRIDLTTEPLGVGKDGVPVYLKDIWPTSAEINQTIQQCLTPGMFQKRYADVFKGGEAWQKTRGETSLIYPWQETSAYIKNPPYFTQPQPTGEEKGKVQGARILAILGDSITTDHISPAGSIQADGPTGAYLRSFGTPVEEFNSYGSRRGNHEVMMRGTFANIRIKNEMLPGTTGGVTKYLPKTRGEAGEILPIYTAAMRYKEDGIPLVVVAGKDYGTGSSRDWAAKGPLLLGVKAIIAESFERIHRSNLVGMGILPLTFLNGESRQSLNLTGEELIDIIAVQPGITPGMRVTCRVTRSNGEVATHTLLCRIDTQDEVAYFQKGGILPYVFEKLY